MIKSKVKSILSAKNGMNLYRGCTHGCIYCDSRSKCYNMNHQFENIEVKVNAVELLISSLNSKREKCMIGMGSMCDPYMHIENVLKLTHKTLEVIDYYGFGLTLITKSDRILNDLDLLKSINSKARCVVQMTLTTYDDALSSIIEPNVCVTSKRAEVLNIMLDNNIETVVWITPLLPFINDSLENLKGILSYCKKAKVKGIITFGFGLTLREGSREYYYQNLDKYFPGLKEKYISAYKGKYILPLSNSKELYDYFKTFCVENNIMYKEDEIFAYLRLFPKTYEQMSIFEM